MAKLASVAAILAISHRGGAFIATAPIATGPGRPAQAHISWTTRGGTDGSCGTLPAASLKEEGVALFGTKDRGQSDHFFGFGDPDHVPSILQNITEQRYLAVAEARKKVSEEELREQMRAFQASNGGTVDLFDRIASEEPDMAIAAEFKRASPSKGDIAVGLDAGEQGSLYASVGAAVLSVLTEPKWFKGSLEDMKEVRLATQGVKMGKTGMRPAILRKDFIVEEYQLLEARANGADTVLLIVAILEIDRLHSLIKACRELEMEPLVEVHTSEEMEIALEAGARVVGVNNRNLHTFNLDLQTTERVSKVAVDMGISWEPQQQSEGVSEKGRIVLSALSGIAVPDDVKRFGDMGVSMVLVGETLMRAADPKEAIRTLLGKEDHAQASGKRLIKVCGVTNVEDALAAAAAGANLIGVIFAEGSPRRVTVDRAREVAKAVQAFGERNAPKLVEPPPKSDVSKDWFQGWATNLAKASTRTPLVVGVFQNQPAEEVRRVVSEAGLDLVQLHGDEGIEACAECGVPALRVVHVPAAGEGEVIGAEARVRSVLDQLPPNFAAGVVLDTTVKGAQGGTGATFDHEVARLVGEAGVPVIIAGGLSAESVEACVASTGSFGVDVSSGVESSKGKKDLQAVDRFVRGAKRAQRALVAQQSAGEP